MDDWLELFHTTNLFLYTRQPAARTGGEGHCLDGTVSGAGTGLPRAWLQVLAHLPRGGVPDSQLGLARPSESLQPQPSLCCWGPAPTPTAARTGFPLPGFNHVTSPLGRADAVPVALYVKSQFLTVSARSSPTAPHLACPHLSACSPNSSLQNSGSDHAKLNPPAP